MISKPQMTSVIFLTVFLISGCASTETGTRVTADPWRFPTRPDIKTDVRDGKVCMDPEQMKDLIRTIKRRETAAKANGAVIGTDNRSDTS